MDIHGTPHSVDLHVLGHHYKADLKNGVSEKDVAVRLVEFGPNSLPEKPPKSIIVNFLLQFKNPLVYLLLVAALLLFTTGEVADPLVVLGVVIINALMGTIQEGRAERSLTALRKLSELDVRVIRGGKEREIPSRGLVPGDLIHLMAGDAVPADARIIDATNLKVIESSLTGEADAVAKLEGQLDQETILAERSNMIYTGTYISSGRCIALVTGTGTHTEVGKIATLAEQGKPAKTPIEERIDRFGKQLSIAAVIAFVLLMVIGFLRKLPLDEIFLAAVSQLVSLIPEGLPAAITIALAVGVQRMANKGAIIRRLVAVETLGSTTVICSDKTGTLTRGEMTIVDVALPSQLLINVEGSGYEPQGRFLQKNKSIDPLSNNALIVLLEAAILCNDSKISFDGSVWRVLGDPTEGALITLARKAKMDDLSIVQEFPRNKEIPFDSRIKMMATAHGEVIMLKGALEGILDLCQTVLIDDEEVELTPTLREEIEGKAEAAALQGKRVLSFARAEGDLPDDINLLKGKALFLGFVAAIDPPREEAVEAVALCKLAGIRPIMATGDHLVTAKAIAKDLGILDHFQAVDGNKLDTLSDDELRSEVKNIAVFARLHPAQKLRIVQALQKNGEVVAMTGDGANDAPALAQADVGVAMGITGTDVAKEAAKMVITDDRFSTIVGAVEQGRLVYNNIKKVIFYLLTTNCAAALTMIIAISLGFPLPMAPVQILWINVITEGTVTINLVLDPPEGDEMSHPPTNPKEHILSGSAFYRFLYTTPAIVALLFFYFIFRFYQRVSLAELQTETFVLLAFCAWFKVISSRSATKSCLNFSFLKNRYLALGLLASVLLQAAVIYIHPLNDVFQTVPLSLARVLILLGIGSIVLWIEEIRKVFLRRLAQ